MCPKEPFLIGHQLTQLIIVPERARGSWGRVRGQGIKALPVAAATLRSALQSSSVCSLLSIFTQHYFLGIVAEM